MSTNDEVRAIFRDEVVESVRELTSLFESLAELPPDGFRDALERARRILHNVKGAARLIGVGDAELIAHLAEDRLSEIEVGSTPDLAVRLLRRASFALLRAVDGKLAEGELEELVEWLGSDHEVSAREPRSSTDRPELESAERSEAPDVPRPIEPDLTSTVRVGTARLDHLMTFAGEMMLHQSRRAARHRELQGLFGGLGDHSRFPSAVRAELERWSRDLGGWLRSEERELRNSGHLTGELAAAIKEVRVQPLRSVEFQWRQTVEELARELGKSARLTTSLGDIELDRQILDGLRDPLMHLLRNAVDHGLESPEERAAMGKDAVGTVAVRARARGTLVDIEVVDDGRGFDVEEVRRQASQRGVRSEEELAHFAGGEVLDLLFESGFSTADEVSQISGRGVGLAIVRRRLAEFGGQVTIEDAGTGAAFRLTVPATLVSTKGLLVRGEKSVSAIPIHSVERIFRVASHDVEQVDGGAVIQDVEGRPLRLRWLATLLGEQRTPDPKHLTVLVVEQDASRMGIVVGEILGEADFVTQRLPWNIARVPGISGALVLGDGEVAVQLDVSHVFGARSCKADERIQAPSKRRRARILVVDDSRTSRILQRNILLAGGFDVVTTMDGEAAWDELRAGGFDLLISDVQMPKLDGIGLTKRVRASADLEQLPVILVTSLDRPEDVAAGADAGANEYIVKGRFEQRTLLEAIERLL